MIKDSLTIIIPCKNEEAYIIKTLESIERQRYSEGLRVIIADANSTDSTRSLINDFAKNSKLSIAIIDGGPVAVGRNAGANLATTNWLLFIDADTQLLNPETLVNCVHHTVFGTYDLITCTVKPAEPNAKVWIAHKLFRLVQAILPESFCPGVFFLIKKSTYIKFDKFDESVHHSEDYLLSKNIEKSRFLILSDGVTQDDRRFKKMGYFGMFKFIFNNYINRKNLDHFRKSINYW
jgi:glycosyltransferase involved in cell wall biosynthesis